MTNYHLANSKQFIHADVCPSPISLAIINKVCMQLNLLLAKIVTFIFVVSGLLEDYDNMHQQLRIAGTLTGCLSYFLSLTN